MAAVLEPRHADISEQTRLEALEQTLRALCEQVGRLIDAARSDDRLGTREARLQLAAFEERRQRAFGLLDSHLTEPSALRIGHLQKLAEAIDCSRSYFSATANVECASNSSADWSVLVR